jgi:hypothetical protein
MDAKARLLAVEVLLADPEQLGNDALEGDLYILRDQLILQGDDTPHQRRLKIRSSAQDQNHHLERALVPPARHPAFPKVGDLHEGPAGPGPFAAWGLRRPPARSRPRAPASPGTPTTCPGCRP